MAGQACSQLTATDAKRCVEAAPTAPKLPPAGQRAQHQHSTPSALRQLAQQRGILATYSHTLDPLPGPTCTPLTLLLSCRVVPLMAFSMSGMPLPKW